MKKGIWENEEVKDLFLEVEKFKDKNKPLKNAFIIHAQKYNRQPNSVRNYYYHEIDNLSKDKKRLSKIGIDLSKHQKYSIIYFSEDEEKQLLNEIDSRVKQGMSVRKACCTLAGGDVEKMLRFQNKYRNFLAKKAEPKDDAKIIKFTKKRTTISESDIQSLFMGLVRLVKRTALEEVTEKLKNDYDNANQKLRQTISELNTKERQYRQLKEDYLKLKNENQKLASSLVNSKCNKANKLREELTSLSQAPKANIKA